MALVHTIHRIDLDRDSAHLDVDCTYAIVTSRDGTQYLQIDTYGSTAREIPGKKSQSIRFSPTATAELKAVIEACF